MRVALYARYSGDNQREASIFDQLRICRLHAEKMGWDVVEEYTDPKISGASMFRRPGIQALISDAGCRRFDVVLAEAMDRLSRDQEDMAGIYKRMTFSDIKIITLSEGEVSPLHVGLKGTMNALFLKDLADKVIPRCIDQNPWAHWRSPRDMMRQGCSTSLFQAKQQWSTMSS